LRAEWVGGVTNCPNDDWEGPKGEIEERQLRENGDEASALKSIQLPRQGLEYRVGEEKLATFLERPALQTGLNDAIERIVQRCRLPVFNSLC